MELKLKDLPIYKESYKNIAIQIKELDIIDNEAEIERLEGVIKENQAEIESWEVHENDQKEFEEYARPYNAKISEAQTKIVELEKGIEENKKQQEKNKKQQEQMKVYMNNIRKNAENYYKETRKNLEQEWENSEEKKQYDSKKEMLEILNSKKDRTPAEAGAIIRLIREMRDIKQAHLNNIKNIEEEYKKFLQDLDTIDKSKLEELIQETPEQETPAPGTPAPETPAPETPAPETPAPGTPAPRTPAPETPAPGTPAPGTSTPGTPTQRTPAPGTPAPGTPAQRTPAPGTLAQPVQLASFKIEVTKDGSRFVIMRDGEEEPQFGDWHESYEAGQHLENIGFIEENKEMLKRAKIIGDKFVINEIILAVTSKQITYEEGKLILNNYVETLSRKEAKDSPFELLYDLRGLTRGDLDVDQKDYIEQKAKEAKQFEKTGNVKVKPGFFRAIGWGLEKIATKVNNLWNKNKALPKPGEKQSVEYMNQRKQELKERLRNTGRVTENQNLGQGLNKALREQDKIKQEIDEGR